MTVVCRRIDWSVNVLAVCLAVLLSITLAKAQQKQTASPQPKTTRVLFLCPHGAAKSVLASTYFRRLAKERGLNVIVDSAGTDPDPSVSPPLGVHLAQQGYPVSTEKPRLVTADDLARADVIVSLGCDLTRSPTAGHVGKVGRCARSE